MGLFDTIGNVVTTAQTNRAQRGLSEYQYSKDLEMWNRNNEYNSPEAQMARLKTAGLNPNLVYGSGSVAGNTSGSLPRYQAPQLRAPEIRLSNSLDVLGRFQDFKLKKENTDNAKAIGDSIRLKNAMTQFDLERKRILLGYEDGLHGWWNTKSAMQSARAYTLPTYYRLLNEGIQAKNRLLGYQGDSVEIQNRELEKRLSQQLENMRTLNSLRNMDLNVRTKDNSWYAPKAVADIFGKAAGGIGSLLNSFGMSSIIRHLLGEGGRITTIKSMK